MSTGLNSMCGVIFEDLIRPAYNKPISERTASFIMKVIVVVIGMLHQIFSLGATWLPVVRRIIYMTSIFRQGSILLLATCS